MGGDTVSRMPELRGTIVLATYNSGASVGPVLAEIEEAASVLNRSGIEIEVLLVDDSSPDNTAAIASDEAARLGLSSKCSPARISAWAGHSWPDSNISFAPPIETSS